jgi:hypothetical protein
MLVILFHLSPTGTCSQILHIRGWQKPQKASSTCTPADLGRVSLVLLLALGLVGGVYLPNPQFAYDILYCSYDLCE